MGIAGSAINIVHVVNATQNQRHITVLFGFVSSTIDILDIANDTTVVSGSRISANIRHRHRGTAAHVTLRITATEDIHDMTAHQLGDSLAGTVVRGRSVIVINTHIGTWITRTGTVTTAEDIIDNIVSQNGDIRSRHRSSITTAIDVLNTGQVTTLDNHLSTSRINLSRIACICCWV